MTPVRDLDYSFQVRGRTYHVQVCGCGSHPAPTSAGESDITLFECIPNELLDHEDDDPYKIAHDAIAHLQKFLPPTISEADWEKFEETVIEWVCDHRAAASLKAHGD